MACLVSLLFIAVLDDLRSWKVSNSLILIGILAGMIYDIYEYGWTGINIWLSGVFLPILLLFPLFMIKALGAGDIKLFSVIGSFCGGTFVLKSIAAAFIVGAGMSLILLIKNKMVYRRFSYLFHYIQRIIPKFISKKATDEKAVMPYSKEGYEGKRIEPYFDGKEKGYEGAVHFSIAVLGGVLFQILF
ncbi:MAG: hypothetical protein ACFWTJ_10605 [Lachnoclostridium sp.]|jgi:prepilin peptidase CpaA